MSKIKLILVSLILIITIVFGGTFRVFAQNANNSNSLFSGKVEAINQDLNLIGLREEACELGKTTKDKISYYSAGKWIKGKYEGYTRIISVNEGNYPYIKNMVFATKDMQNFVVDGRFLGASSCTGDGRFTLPYTTIEEIKKEGSLGLNFQKIKLSETLPNDFDDALKLDDTFGALPNEDSSLVFEKDMQGFTKLQGNNDKFQIYSDPGKETSDVIFVDSTGLGQRYSLAFNTEIDSYVAKKQLYDQKLKENKYSSPEYPYRPTLSFSGKDIKGITSEENQNFCPAKTKLYTNPNYPEMKICYDEGWEMKENNIDEFNSKTYFSKNNTTLDFNFTAALDGNFNCTFGDNITPSTKESLTDKTVRVKDTKLDNKNWHYVNTDLLGFFCSDILQSLTLTPYNETLNTIPKGQFGYITAMEVFASLDDSASQELIQEADQIVLNSCFTTEECDKLKKVIQATDMANKAKDAISGKVDDSQIKNQVIELEFNRNCDGRTNLNKSSIPVPELTEINQDQNNQWNYNIKGISKIKKGTKIKAKIWYDKCGWFYTKNSTEYKEFIIDQGLNKVVWNAYKDTIQGKTEDIVKNTDVPDNGQFNFDVRKRGGIDAWPDGKKVWETDQIYTKLEIYGDFEVELPDIGKVKFDYGKDKHESEKSNIVKLNMSILKNGDKDSIEEIFDVRGGNPDGLLITAEVENRRDVRKAKLRLSDEDQNKNPDWKYKDKLPKDANIWIISHGWNDYDNPKFREIAETIKKDYPKDIVLTLNWSEASTNGQIPGSPAPDPKGVCRASTWIKSTAEQVYNKLNQIWGINRGDGKKVRVIGHSLGSIISTEISQQFNQTKHDNSTSGADLLIALDPPSEISCATNIEINSFGLPSNTNDTKNSINGKYRITPTKKRKDFGGNARFTRSFVGRNSFAGNQNFAKTADDSFWMDFSKDRDGKKEDKGEEHGWVVGTYDRMIDDTKIKNIFYDNRNLYNESGEHVLDLLDQNSHKSWERKFGEHRGSVETNEPDNVDRLLIKIDDVGYRFYQK